MADNYLVILALVPVTVGSLYYAMYKWRYGNFAHIPSALPRNIFIGHLGYTAAEYKNFGSSTVHPDYVFESIWKKNGQPGFLFLDLRPVVQPMLLVCSHEIAEQVTRPTKTQPYSVTKSPTLGATFRRIIGDMPIQTENGESWKTLRKRFNPGFAPGHLLSLLPVVIDKTYIFMEKLDALAASGRATELESFCANVTFDIIGEVVTNIDCKTQDDAGQDNDMVRTFRVLSATYVGESGLVPTWMNFPLHIRRYIYSSRLDTAVKSCIRDKFAAMQTGKANTAKDRSVLALALKDTDALTPLVLQSIADQVKNFLFAGHDTTSILLQRLFYALSIHPLCLEKIRAEHESIFGDSEPREVFLARPDETMKALVYTSACIKETLRLWPPGASVRMSHNGFTIRTPAGEDVCVNECVIYLNHHIIQRDRTVYGETAEDFVPERWVGDSDPSSASSDEDGHSKGASQIPIGAWRAFERGPRNCIGQELANLEARVILACVMRRYDFVKIGVGETETDENGKPIVDEKGKYRTKSELLSTMVITSKPIDRTVMKVKRRQPSA